MFGMYVHIKAVTYVTFLNKCDFYQSWSDRSTRSIVKQVDILAVCTYTVCDVLLWQLNMSLDHACWEMQKETYVIMWKENYQNTRIVN